MELINYMEVILLIISIIAAFLCELRCETTEHITLKIAYKLGAFASKLHIVLNMIRLYDLIHS